MRQAVRNGEIIMDITTWRKPPESALKKIGGGRLKGMSDINPQWRIDVMNEKFGPCGIGWTWKFVRTWTESCGDEVAVFVEILVEYEEQGTGLKGSIPGIGGNMLYVKESAGLRLNDEAYKMATTDALSVSMKFLGIGADIYLGSYDGSKYRDSDDQPAPARPAPAKPAAAKKDAPLDKKHVEGMAEDVKMREKGTGVCVGGVTYGVYGQQDVSIGDFVSFDWIPSPDGKYKNIIAASFSVVKRDPEPVNDPNGDQDGLPF